MPPNILFIGATGHIGAAVLDALLTAHPDLSIHAIIRSIADAEDLKDTYQTITTSVGDLSNLPLLESAASKAEIVINTAPDVGNTPSLTALLTGLVSSAGTPKFYLHTSGAARIWSPPESTHTWSDLDTAPLPTTTMHAAEDTLVQSFTSRHPNLHTAIISPTFVLGVSPSTRHKTPIIFPYLWAVLKDIGLFTVGGSGGENGTGVADTGKLAGLYVRLVENALKGNVDEGVWGWYWGNTWDGTFIEFLAMVKSVLEDVEEKGDEGSEVLERVVGGGEIADISVEKAIELMVKNMGGEEMYCRHIAEGFGLAMKVGADRARKVLGYDMAGLDGFGEAVRAMEGV
ncbi:hypothetical protein OQA88_7474 [Cercophora sp. LCS_1]